MPAVVTLYHGTDLASAEDLVRNGVDAQKAAQCNASGEFWASTSLDDATWYAHGNPDSPPAARLEFDLPLSALQTFLQMVPPGVNHYQPSEYEFLPHSFPLLNQFLRSGKVHIIA